MAGRGAAQGTQTRDRSGIERISLVADGKTRGYALPKNFLTDPKTGEVIPWHPATVRWWNHWRKSPQATRMLTMPDWDFLLDTAVIHHWMWSKGDFERASEVRLRVQQFGATPEARQRLRADVVAALPDAREQQVRDDERPSRPVASIADRRARLA